MGNLYQLHAVAEMCPKYTPVSEGLYESVEEDITSCKNCIHWVNNRCNIDIYDEVLTSLDQT